MLSYVAKYGIRFITTKKAYLFGEKAWMGLVKNLGEQIFETHSLVSKYRMHFKKWFYQFSMDDNITDAFGTLRDFGERWKYELPSEKDFAALVEKIPVRTLVPSKMKAEKFKLNNTSATFALIGKGLESRGIITGLKLAGKKTGRRYSAWDSVKYHSEQLKNGESPPLVFVKQDDNRLTLLDGDHRLVAAYLMDLPFKAIFIPEKKLKSEESQ
jgi:hypothetical protein